MTYWTPAVGDLVWMNRPDFDEPEGRVVAIKDDEPRLGQPIIERVADLPGPFGGYRRGERVVIHPMFLLPFPYGGPEWLLARAEGRVG